MHFDQLQRHGGAFGIKDENALESALARARHRWLYEPDADLCALAASYGYGFARSHAYTDGNKRVAFMAMYVFLAVNGQEIVAPEPEVVKLMRDVAAGSCDESTLATWLREHVERLDD
jgi:death-on-curing protein